MAGTAREAALAKKLVHLRLFRTAPAPSRPPVLCIARPPASRKNRKSLRRRFNPAFPDLTSTSPTVSGQTHFPIAPEADRSASRPLAMMETVPATPGTIHHTRRRRSESLSGVGWVSTQNAMSRQGWALRFVHTSSNVSTVNHG